MNDKIKFYVMLVAFMLSVGSMLIAVGQTNKTVKTNEVKVAEFDKRIDEIEKNDEGDSRDLKNLKESVDKFDKKLDRLLERP